MKVNVRITISLKKGMLDPEARAIRHALENLGFATEALSTARVFLVTMEAGSKKEAKERAAEMCGRLLANPVIHRYQIEVLE
ncbi:MAG: phosphoribosylformylglycinamidine synthase subunit PurS [Methanomicrobiales archaeon]|nr:phosphoribosylformylglycinamidine synthase subunit PurS [Methanomicrobiales archaeon]MDD1655526.1 phosphoribosylformylglycinamidine synthase subunit PurS [Methanomicrobiales archaeon]